MSTTIGIYTFDHIEPSSREKAIIGGFIEALYWSNYELSQAELSNSAKSTIANLCTIFAMDNVGTLDVLERYGHSMDYIGGLLCLTLDGAGTGFWECEKFNTLQVWLDNYYIDRTGRAVYTVDPYLGDDGLVYFAGLSIFQIGLAT